MKRLIHFTAILVLLFLAPAAAASAAPAALSRSLQGILNRLGEDKDVTVVYLTGDMIKSMNSRNFGDIPLLSVSDCIESLNLYVCQSRRSADIAREYVDRLTGSAPAPVILSKVKNGDGTLRIYGIGSDGGRYSALIILLESRSQARLMLLDGDFGPREIALLAGGSDSKAQQSADVSVWPEIEVGQLTNASSKYLEISLYHYASTLGNDVRATYHYASGHGSATVKASEKRIVGSGKALYVFRFPYTDFFSDSEDLELYVDGRVYPVKIKHNFPAAPKRLTREQRTRIDKAPQAGDADLMLDYLSNASGKYLELRMKYKSDKMPRNVNATYHFVKGGPKTVKALDKRVVGGETEFVFRFPYTSVFHRHDTIDVDIDGREYRIISSHY